MDKTRIQILIPTFNQVQEIELTIKSIREQQFNQENIYITIIDFGSTDGTYEKLLSYNCKNMGIYKIEFQKNENQRIAEAGKILGYVWPGGANCFAIIVYPGERLYTHCLRTLVTQYLENPCKNIKMVICESDVLLEDGTIIHQKPLFEEDRIIDGHKEVTEYIGRGYMHQIFHMGGNFNTARYKASPEINERRFWNKLAREGNEAMALYVKEALACTKPIIYSDEFKEILYRWEAIISIVRFYTNKFSHGFNDNFEELAGKNLAEYALWRSFLLYKRGIRTKQTEDCFLIASVIDEEMIHTEIYQRMHKLLMEGESQQQAWIQEYYESAII